MQKRLPIFGRWRQVFEFWPMWFGLPVILIVLLAPLIWMFRDFWNSLW